MSQFTVRNFKSSDFETIMKLEQDVFAADGESVLCPYYVRLCCDFFSESCFLAFDGDKPIGYVLSFVKDRTAYCTTLAIHPDYHKTRAIMRLLKAFVSFIVDRVDLCWFTVDEDNAAARSVHRMLGAVEEGFRPDFYGPGVGRLVSSINRAKFEAMRSKYERLGLVDRPQVVEEAA